MSSSGNSGSGFKKSEAAADRLFGAFAVGDIDTVADCFAPGATWWLAPGPARKFEEVLPLLRVSAAQVGEHGHANVRRIYGIDGFVEQHRAQWRDPSGEALELDVCSVVRLDESGHIKSFEEYRDTAGLVPESFDPVAACIAQVDRHVMAEFTNDVDAIVSTISQKDCLFALLSPTQEGVSAQTAANLDEARSYYSATRDSFTLLSSSRISDVNSHWYSFHESVGTLEVQTDAGEIKAVEVPSAVLFPVASDGIIGELGWERVNVEEVKRGIAGSEAPRPGVASHRSVAELHQELQAAWYEAASDRIAPLLHQDCKLILRTMNLTTGEGASTVADGRAESALALANLVKFRAKPKVINCLVTNWYLFCEYRIEHEVEGGRKFRSLAIFCPIESDGTVRACLGYGVER